ncbi:MAG: isochorismatase family protein [Xanthobacteraceae bacterium]|nr:isochorismatase family protein [Xanthobacteraceae bacterium]
MSSVVDFRTFLASGPVPTLVLLDLQQDCLSGARRLDLDHSARALDNCGEALTHARRMGFPIAFVRRSRRTSAPGPAAALARWIERFEPRGSEMVFERDKPSCFASPLFADVMATSGGPIVLAGFSGESACLSTAIDAFHRGYDFTFLSDASASRAVGGTEAGQVHALLTQVIRLYGDVADTGRWVRSTTAIRAYK